MKMTKKNGFNYAVRAFQKFGLKNTPAIFSRLMSSILAGLTGPSILVYLDNTIIFSKTLDEHYEKLKKVFDRLQEYNLKLKQQKCQK